MAPDETLLMCITTAINLINTLAGLLTLPRVIRGIEGHALKDCVLWMVQMDNRSVSDFVSGTRKAFCVLRADAFRFEKQTKLDAD